MGQREGSKVQTPSPIKHVGLTAARSRFEGKSCSKNVVLYFGGRLGMGKTQGLKRYSRGHKQLKT